MKLLFIGDIVGKLGRSAVEQVLPDLRQKEKIDFAVVNFANADMVGHTGNIPATVKACETIDRVLSRIIPVVSSLGGLVLITADHGNAEELIDNQSGGINTEHSSYPVPFIAVAKKLLGKGQSLGNGILADIAPTILAILKIKPPTQMTGRNLLVNILD